MRRKSASVNSKPFEKRKSFVRCSCGVHGTASAGGVNANAHGRPNSGQIAVNRDDTAVGAHRRPRAVHENVDVNSLVGVDDL